MQRSFRHGWVLGLCVAAIGLGGCSARDHSDGAAAKTATAKPMADVTATGSAAQGQCSCNEDGTRLPGQCAELMPAHEPGGAECPEQAPPGAVPDEVRERRDPSGRMVQHVGAEFSNAPPMTVTDALAGADKLAGKPVQLEGYVSAMCQHRRAWFAVVGRDQTGDTVRVLTAPAFLVPAGVVGKQVRVEGTLASAPLSAETAKHLTSSHKLPTTNAPGGTGTEVVMNATVAEFF